MVAVERANRPVAVEGAGGGCPEHRDRGEGEAVEGGIGTRAASTNQALCITTEPHSHAQPRSAAAAVRRRCGGGAAGGH